MNDSKYILTLRPMPSAVPDAIRLRRVLKLLLRTYGFRCVDVREVIVHESGVIRESAATPVVGEFQADGGTASPSTKLPNPTAASTGDCGNERADGTATPQSCSSVRLMCAADDAKHHFGDVKRFDCVQSVQSVKIGGVTGPPPYRRTEGKQTPGIERLCDA